jgi:hypothetical protein
MYAGGALHVLQSSNPDRTALAAHGIRELIEKLPDHIDVASAVTGDALKQPKRPPSLTVQVRELEQQWKPCSRPTSRHGDSRWRPEADAATGRAYER